MKIGSVRESQNSKKAHIIHPHSLYSDPDILAKYIMCLDGAAEVRLSLTEDILTLDGEETNKKRKIHKKMQE